MNLIKTIAFSFLLLILLPVKAGVVSKIEISENQIEKDKEIAITLQFANSSSAIACGIQVDWGDGKVERFRVGEGQQVPPPYKLNHAYSTPNTYKIRINGELLIRGLRSLAPCEVKREGTITVVDPIELAKQNELKAAAESERLAKSQAEAQERQIRQAQLAIQAEEQRKLQEARQAQLAAQAEEQRRKQQSEIEASLRKASIKSCEQFIDAFKSRYRFAYDWPDLKCTFANEKEAAFVIAAYNQSRAQYGPSAYSKFYYQPKTETVLGISGRGSETIYNVKNFIDVSKASDMNASGEIALDNIPPEQIKIVCDKIDTVATNIVNQHEFRIGAGFEAAEVAKAGNWNFNIVSAPRNCSIRFSISGNYQGNSIRKTVSCKVGQVIKQTGDKYMATSVAFSGGACN